MKINIVTRSKAKRELMETLSSIYLDLLNLKNSKFSLTICTVFNLAKTKKANGITTNLGNRSILLQIDSRMKVYEFVSTLAHEMVHVKQIAKGQVKHYTKRNGKTQTLWLGKSYDEKDYYDKPWEQEAFGREKLLTNKLTQMLSRTIHE